MQQKLIKLTTLLWPNAIISILIGIFANLAFWKQFTNIYTWEKSSFFIISVGVLLIQIIFITLTLFFNRLTFKPFCVFLFAILAPSAHVMDSYGHIINVNTITNILDTHLEEATELFTPKFLLYIFFLFALPIYVLFKIPIKYSTFKMRLKLILFTFILILGNILAFSKQYASFFRNHKIIRYYSNPVTPVYSLIKYLADNPIFKLKAENLREQLGPISITPSIRNLKPTLFLFIVGETARFHNFSINGYTRKTNPNLEQINNSGNLISYKNFYSCGTETAVSLPCMFSHLGQSQFSILKAKKYENVLDLLKRAGVQIYWKENDGGCKGVCDRVMNFHTNEDHDKVLLEGVQKTIDDFDFKKNILIVLHQKGNHGPAYYKRYPREFATFLPECKSAQLESCANAEIINAYDNGILYTDHFIHECIKILQKNKDKFDVGLMYVSDHGESLGEFGVYLHALPYWVAPDYQTHIPAIIWADESIIQKKLLNLPILKKRETIKLNHDYLFHTLLGIYSVSGPFYNNKLDLLFP